MRNSCRNVDVLPEGATAEGLYASRMQELAESVVDLPTLPGMKESVSVGKVLAVEQGGGGDELELHWYMPATVRSGDPRSKYGKGRWVEEFVVDHGKRVPSVGEENVAAVSSTFANLTKQGKLPTHVWASVAESIAPSSEEEEGETDEEEEEGDEEEAKGDEDESLVAQGGGIAGSGEGQQALVLLPGSPSPQLVALVRALPPPNIRITAAYNRPRRSNVSGQF